MAMKSSAATLPVATGTVATGTAVTGTAAIGTAAIGTAATETTAKGLNVPLRRWAAQRALPQMRRVP
jgi:hypothetical protein